MTGTDMYAGIYVKDVTGTAKVLASALGAKTRQLQPNLMELIVGNDRLLLNQQEMTSEKIPQNTSSELELGVWVDNLDAVYQNVQYYSKDNKCTIINYISNIESKKSGIKDFRFRINEGYYVRVTAPSK